MNFTTKIITEEEFEFFNKRKDVEGVIQSVVEEYKSQEEGNPWEWLPGYKLSDVELLDAEERQKRVQAQIREAQTAVQLRSKKPGSDCTSEQQLIAHQLNRNGYKGSTASKSTATTTKKTANSKKVKYAFNYSFLIFFIDTYTFRKSKKIY